MSSLKARENLRIVLVLSSVGLSFLLYCLTMAPDITWAHNGADGGDLAIAVFLGSVPHPTGYPTYLLFAQPFARLPLWPPIRRLTLISAVSASVAVGAISWLTFTLAARVNVPPYLAAGLGSGLLATSPLFWSQAIITEVYALHAFFIAALMLLLLIAETPFRWGLLGGLVGLGLGNHLSLVFLLPSAGFLLRERVKGTRRHFATMGIMFMLALSIYTLLPWRSQQGMPFNWGNTATWNGFWWEVSAHLYHSFLRVPTWTELLNRARQLAALTVDQFTLLGFPLLIWGILRAYMSKNRPWVLFAISGAVFYSIWPLFYTVEDWQVYTLPIWLLLAPWVGIGTADVLEKAVVKGRRWRGEVPVLLAAGFVLLSLFTRLGKVDLHADRSARDNLRAIWAHLPPNAILLVDGDRATFGLSYTHLV